MHKARQTTACASPASRRHRTALLSFEQRLDTRALIDRPVQRFRARFSRVRARHGWGDASNGRRHQCLEATVVAPRLAMIPSTICAGPGTIDRNRVVVEHGRTSRGFVDHGYTERYIPSRLSCIAQTESLCSSLELTHISFSQQVLWDAAHTAADIPRRNVGMFTPLT